MTMELIHCIHGSALRTISMFQSQLFQCRNHIVVHILAGSATVDKNVFLTPQQEDASPDKTEEYLA